MSEDAELRTNYHEPRKAEYHVPSHFFEKTEAKKMKNNNKNIRFGR